MAILTPPKVLREKLGEDGVDALIDLVNKANEKQKEDVLVFVEEKFEGRLTVTEEKFEGKLSIMEEKFDNRLSLVEEKFERRLSEVKSELELKMERIRTDLIKWMFIFWVGQTGVIIGLVLTLFKVLLK
ncbi:MAG: hypothetical protein AB1546_02350 [bacterium]